MARGMGSRSCMPEPAVTSAPLGAFPKPDGMGMFRVWAPRARSVAVRTDRGQFALEAAPDGIFQGRGPADADDHYEFILDDRERWPDPCARWQPRGLHGPSRVLDLSALTDGLQRRPVALADLVIYELHVGTFTRPARSRA